MWRRAWTSLIQRFLAFLWWVRPGCCLFPWSSAIGSMVSPNGRRVLRYLSKDIQSLQRLELWSTETMMFWSKPTCDAHHSSTLVHFILFLFKIEFQPISSPFPRFWQKNKVCRGKKAHHLTRRMRKVHGDDSSHRWFLSVALARWSWHMLSARAHLQGATFYDVYLLQVIKYSVLKPKTQPHWQQHVLSTTLASYRHFPQASHLSQQGLRLQGKLTQLWDGFSTGWILQFLAEPITKVAPRE